MPPVAALARSIVAPIVRSLLDGDHIGSLIPATALLAEDGTPLRAEDNTILEAEGL